MNEDHFRWFDEFCRYEKLTGGPDPHLRAVVEMARGLPLEEQVWRVGLYVGYYNVPSAELTWSEFPRWPGERRMLRFLRANWDRLRFRRERKSVALDVTRGERMTGYCCGAVTAPEKLPQLRGAEFEQVWRFALSLPHVGRYAATKLCEAWHRLGLVTASCPDIRAKGGWSPRTAVNMILGDEHDVKDDTRAGVAEAEARAARIKELHPELSWFELEVLLCEYKASYSTRRQYPGRSLDSELAYERAVNPDGHETEHMRVRRLLSPEWALGEVQGWDPGERLANLGRVVSEHGYTWSDLLYDYRATTNFANPVRRA